MDLFAQVRQNVIGGNAPGTTSIDAAGLKLMRQVAPGGGYVFRTANSVLMDVPSQNLEAMSSAARRYGQYPIR
jgi:uroporphyrinogen-III decarboxylase